MQETGFAAALRAATPAGGSDAGSDGRLHALLAAEDERASNAAVLAELLTPLLAERLATMFARLPAESSAGLSADSLPAARGAAPPRRSPTDPAPTIADLIEGMLVQERAASRPSARRTS